MRHHGRIQKPLAAALAAPLLLGTIACHGSSSGGSGGTKSQQDAVTFGPETRLDTDVPVPGWSDQPQVCVDGRRVVTVWRDERSGDRQLYCNTSDDGGTTWLADDVLIPGSEGAGSHDSPTMLCMDGDRVYVAWQHDPLDDGEDQAYVSASEDGGLTWFATPVEVDETPPGASDADDPAIACCGSNVYVVWKDDRDGTDDIYFNRSTDGGVTWEGEMRLRTVAPGSSHARRHWIEVEGDTVAVVWMDERAGEYDLRLSCSMDGGVTWAVDDVSVEADVPGAALSDEPRMVLEGSEILVAWEDYRNDVTEADIYFNRSTDYGATWLPADVRLDDAPPGEHTDEIEIARDGSHVVVAWERDFPDRVYANVSDDGGETWLPQEVRIDDVPDGDDADDPDIAIDGSVVLICFEDDRAGEKDIRVVTSVDGGNSWRPSRRVDQDAPGAGCSESPEVALSGESFSIVWRDERNGDGDIYQVTGTVKQPGGGSK